MFKSILKKYKEAVHLLNQNAIAFLLKGRRVLSNQRGLTTLETIGLMLLAVVVIVLLYTLIKEYLPTLWGKITGKLDEIN